MIFARATGDDLPAILDLEGEGFEHGAWSADSWRAELESADRHVLVARGCGGDVVGVATFQATFETADLHRVVVRADRRGEGIGRRLVCAGLEWAQAMGAESMLLEVEQFNDAARHLYALLGFEPIARRADYYGPGLDALVLSRALGQTVKESA